MVCVYLFSGVALGALHLGEDGELGGVLGGTGAPGFVLVRHLHSIHHPPRGLLVEVHARQHELSLVPAWKHVKLMTSLLHHTV